MDSTHWTSSWYSFTDAAVRHNAPSAPGILAIAVPRGEWLLVRASLNLRAELLELLSERDLSDAGDVVFSTEFPARGPFDERVERLKAAAAPRWGSGEGLTPNAGRA